MECGELQLDDTIEGERYTLRQLLRHESGLPDYGGLAAYHEAVAASAKPWEKSEFLSRTRAEELIFPPGVGWGYSNIGYLKVGEIICRVTGRSLGDAVQDLILSRGGFSGVRFANRPTDLTDVHMGTASGYHPGWVSHGLLVGRIVDAARLLRGLLSGCIIGTSMLAEMRAARHMPRYRNKLWLDPAYGLGLMMPGIEGGLRLMGHTGEGPGSAIAVYALEGDAGTSVGAVWKTDAGSAVTEETCVALLRSRSLS